MGPHAKRVLTRCSLCWAFVVAVPVVAQRILVLAPALQFAPLVGPFLWLHDAEGRPWHTAPYKMSPADIETYVRHRFPEIFLTFLRNPPVMTVH
jgi:hypothetical protein